MNVRFARSASRHRVSKESIQRVIAHYVIRFEEPPPAGREGVPDTRLVFLGDDAEGKALEVMAVELPKGGLLVITRCGYVTSTDSATRRPRDDQDQDPRWH